MSAMAYEGFIRGAFSIEKRELIDRWGDPASLANTDVYTSATIEQAKAGVAYAMEVYRTYIVNDVGGVSNDDDTSMLQCLKDVINAANRKDIIAEIEKFKRIRDKYYTHLWNR